MRPVKDSAHSFILFHLKEEEKTEHLMVEETGPYGHRTMKFSEVENEHERANLGGEEEKEKVGYGGSDGTRLLEGSVKLAPCAIICISISATKRAVNVHKKGRKRHSLEPAAPLTRRTSPVISMLVGVAGLIAPPISLLGGTREARVGRKVSRRNSCLLRVNRSPPPSDTTTFLLFLICC